MPEYKNITLRAHKGQILIAAPFLILFLVGGIFLCVNVGLMAKEYVKMQACADITARSGSYVQAQSLMTITVINDALIYYYARLGCDVACIIVTLGTAAKCWEAAGEDYQSIRSKTSMADRLKSATPGLSKTLACFAAKDNGADSWNVEVSGLDLEWTTSKLSDVGIVGKILAWILNKFDLKGLFLRANNNIRERSRVTVTKSGRPVYGIPIMDKNLSFPDITAASAGMPYWFGLDIPGGWHDPGNDNTGEFICMIEAGPFWSSKLTKW